MNRKVKKSSVPPNECNEWGEPNDMWESVVTITKRNLPCGEERKK